MLKEILQERLGAESQSGTVPTKTRAALPPAGRTAAAPPKEKCLGNKKGVAVVSVVLWRFWAFWRRIPSL